MEPLNILFVEDSKTLQMIFSKKFLKDTPHQVDFADNGKIGYEKYSAGSYHIVFMDMEMPVMDGFESTRLIRRWEKEHAADQVPIIAMTGHTEEEKIIESYEAGCTEYMKKPLKQDELFNILEKYGSP